MSGAKDDKPTVVEAMAAVMEDVRAVGKGDRNTQQNYSFRGIDAVVNAVGPIFRKHQVVPMPVLESVNYRDVQTSNGKPSRECTVTVRYRFFGPAGDSIDAVTPGESMDFGDKGAPKAMSVAYRIALLQALCLPTTDTDPDAESYERAVGGGQPAQQGQAFSRGGGGDGQRNGQRKQPESEDTPQAARSTLSTLCKARNLAIADVDAEYQRRSNGKSLGDETSPAAIRAFIDGLNNGSITVSAAEPAGAAS